jgi:hypothetical protein
MGFDTQNLGGIYGKTKSDRQVSLAELDPLGQLCQRDAEPGAVKSEDNRLRERRLIMIAVGVH